MKKLFLLSFFIFLFSDTIKIIEEIKKIEQFKPKFKSVQNFNVFSFNKKRQKIVKKDFSFTLKKDLTLQIYAIFQNRVNINGEWFEVGDMIDGYKIAKINKNFVLLKKGNSKKILKIFSINKLKIE